MITSLVLAPKEESPAEIAAREAASSLSHQYEHALTGDSLLLSLLEGHNLSVPCTDWAALRAPFPSEAVDLFYRSAGGHDRFLANLALRGSCGLLTSRLPELKQTAYELQQTAYAENGPLSVDLTPRLSTDSLRSRLDCVLGCGGWSTRFAPPGTTGTMGSLALELGIGAATRLGVASTHGGMAYSAMERALALAARAFGIGRGLIGDARPIRVELSEDGASMVRQARQQLVAADCVFDRPGDG